MSLLDSCSTIDFSETNEQKIPEAVARKCSVEKVFLEIPQNTQGHTCASVSFSIKLQAYRPCNFIKKETLGQVPSCEFCQMSRNTFFKTSCMFLTLSTRLTICQLRIQDPFKHLGRSFFYEKKRNLAVLYLRMEVGIVFGFN